MIYELIAPEQETRKRQRKEKYVIGERNKVMIAQPSLFKVCRSIRCESIPLFYKMHSFYILIEKGSQSLEALRCWLKEIGVRGRLNIGHLRVIFRQRFEMTWVLYIEYILGKLSDNATIIFYANTLGNYRAQLADVRKFYQIREAYLGMGISLYLESPKLMRFELPRHLPEDWYYPSWGSGRMMEGSETRLIFQPESVDISENTGWLSPTFRSVSSILAIEAASSQ